MSLRLFSLSTIQLTIPKQWASSQDTNGTWNYGQTIGKSYVLPVPLPDNNRTPESVHVTLTELNIRTPSLAEISNRYMAKTGKQHFGSEPGTRTSCTVLVAVSFSRIFVSQGFYTDF